MPKYIIEATYSKTEYWEVEAASEVEAENKYYDGEAKLSRVEDENCDLLEVKELKS